MAQKRTNKQHRHYKTLIVLVFSMTAGTFFLYGLAMISPAAIPLQSRSAYHWNRIVIRATTADAPRGFFHFRIDDEGRIFESRAWDAGRPIAPSDPSTIHVLLTCEHGDLQVSPVQYDKLTLFISRLRKKYSIVSENVAMEAPPGSVADARPKLRRT